MSFKDFVTKHWKAILIVGITIVVVILVLVFLNKIIAGITGLIGLASTMIALKKKEKEHDAVIEDTNIQIEASKKRQEEIKKQLEREGAKSKEIEENAKKINDKVDKMDDQQLLDELKRLSK